MVADAILKAGSLSTQAISDLDILKGNTKQVPKIWEYPNQQEGYDTIDPRAPFLFYQKCDPPFSVGDCFRFCCAELLFSRRTKWTRLQRELNGEPVRWRPRTTAPRLPLKKAALYRLILK